VLSKSRIRQRMAAYCAGCLVLLTIGFAAGCQKSKKPGQKNKAATKRVSADAAVRGGTPDVADTDTAQKKVQPQRRMPPPLRPRMWTQPVVDRTRETSCTVLVNKVCAILSEGAEECTVARRRLERRPHTVSEPRCLSALNWFRNRVEKRKRVWECKLLAQAKCTAYGDESIACATATARLGRREKKTPMRQAACRADLLLFNGLP
jgi:hypothetical protein